MKDYTKYGLLQVIEDYKKGSITKDELYAYVDEYTHHTYLGGIETERESAASWGNPSY